MVQFLFSPSGRFDRRSFWGAVVIYVVAAAIAGMLLYVLTLAIPGDNPTPGEFNVSGPAAIPFIAVVALYNVLAFWSGICVGVKRYHDRDKSGWWVLIIFVPIIGSIWYLIETGFLRGTAGPNRFGSDPVLT